MKNDITISEFVKKTEISLSTVERLRGEKKNSSSQNYHKNYISKSCSSENPKKKILTYNDRLKMMIYEAFYREDKKPVVEKILERAEEFIEEKMGNLEECIRIIYKARNRKELNKILENPEEAILEHFKIKKTKEIDIEAILDSVPEVEEKARVGNQIREGILNISDDGLNALGKIFYENYRKDHGLLNIQHPTGNGKTYSMEVFCAYVLKNDLAWNPERKIIIITNNKININGIQKGIREKVKDVKNLYEDNVFTVLSNEDILQKKEVFKQVIHSLENDKIFFQRFEKEKVELIKIRSIMEYCKNVQGSGFNYYEYSRESIKKLDKYLKKYLKEPEEIREAIPLPKFYHELYPMMDEVNQKKKIFLMTTDKFLYGYFTGIKNEYFYEKEGNLIIMDEIDSTKDVFLNYIKKHRSQRFGNVIEEFNSRLNNFAQDENNLTSVLIDHFRKNELCSLEDIEWIEKQIEKYREDGAALRKKYGTTAGYFQLLEQENIDLFQRKNHFYEKNGKKLYVSKAGEHWEIGTRKKHSFELSSLINDLQYFSQDKLFHIISSFVDKINKSIAISEDTKTNEIIQHFFQNSGLRNKIQEEYREFFSFRQKKKKEKDVYYQDCKYVSLYKANPGWRHNNRCEMSLYQMYETPESLLVKIAQNNMVYGVSATAGNQSILGNFDQGWLRKILKKDFLIPTPNQRKILKDELKLINSYEKQIERTLNLFNPDEYDNKEYLKGFENIISKLDQEKYDELIDKIEIVLDSYPGELRYSLIYAALVFTNFFLDDRTKSLLFLSNRLSDKEEALKNIAEVTAKKCKVKYFLKKYDTKALEKDLNDKGSDLLLELEKQEKKVIIFTSYQSAGKGVNIKFKHHQKSDENIVMIDPETNKLFNYPIDEKDIDEIALENRTNLSKIEKNSHEEKLTQLYWLNILEENGILDEKTRHNIANSSYDYALTTIYKTTEDYIENALLWIIQGLGRVNRTKVKCRKRNIYLDMEGAYNIADFNVNRREMVEDFYFIKETLDKDYTYFRSEKYRDEAEICDEKNTLLQASFREKYLEKIQNLNGMIRKNPENNSAQEQLKNLTEKYENLREYILKNPTEKSPLLEEFYLKFSEETNSYSHYTDSSNNIIEISTTEKGRVSKEESRLDLLFEIDELKKLLQENVGSFEKNPYIILPYVYQAIFKGKLGELIIKKILRDYEIKFLNEDEKVQAGMMEIFDDMLSEGGYIDYKNYNLDKLIMRTAIDEDLEHRIGIKAPFISQEKKLFIINLISPKEERKSEKISFYRIDREKGRELLQVKEYNQSEIVVVAGVIRYDSEKLTMDYDALRELTYLMKRESNGI